MNDMEYLQKKAEEAAAKVAAKEADLAKVEAIKTAVKDKVIEVFARYGKTYENPSFNYSHDVKWEGALSFGLYYTKSSSWYEDSLTNTVVQLTTNCWHQTLNKNNELMTYRNRSRKIPMTLPLTEILDKVEDFMEWLPLDAERLAAAKAIIDKAQAVREESYNKRATTNHKLSKLTGYPMMGDSVSYPHAKPYTKLDGINGSDDRVKIELQLPLDKFEELHKFLLELYPSDLIILGQVKEHLIK
jgi:hypothetical protein